MANCLVVGGNGFLGSHLVDRLAADGHRVRAFDVYTTPQQYTSLGVECWVGDFLNDTDLDRATAGQQYVFHFLSTTTPSAADNNPVRDIETNLMQSVRLFQSCAEHGVERVYFASTGGAIYGLNAPGLLSETHAAEPVSPYGIGKLAIERYLDYFRLKHGLESVALRISNPYGTRQHPVRKQGLIPIVLRQIANGEPVTQYGDGSMVRDYLFVADLVEMIARFVDAQPKYPVYNLGSGVGHSVAEVLSLIRAVTGRELDIQRQPTPATFVPRVILDTSRFVTEFGAAAATPLEVGIAATWKEIHAHV
ncbi:MAG: NAD-dependent epimerase/dehydratase family protein [Cumulibacter sp.]